MIGKALQAFLDSKSVTAFGDSDLSEILLAALDAYLVAVCDWSMPRNTYHGDKNSVHWWTQEISNLRKISLAARRDFQRARKRRSPDLCRELEQMAKGCSKNIEDSH